MKQDFNHPYVELFPEKRKAVHFVDDVPAMSILPDIGKNDDEPNDVAAGECFSATETSKHDKNVRYLLENYFIGDLFTTSVIIPYFQEMIKE